jgi:hypothetical protein
MKILMITKFVPVPADGGGKRRSLAILEELIGVGDVTLCAFLDDSSDTRAVEDMGVRVRAVPWRPGPKNILRGLAHAGSVTAARFHDPAMVRVVGEAARPGVDHLQVEYTQLTPYARGVRARTRFLDMHNVESALASSYARAHRGPGRLAYRIEAAALRRMERRAVAAFDVTSVVSDVDRRLLSSTSNTIVAPNG